MARGGHDWFWAKNWLKIIRQNIAPLTRFWPRVMLGGVVCYLTAVMLWPLVQMPPMRDAEIVRLAMLPLPAGMLEPASDIPELYQTVSAVRDFDPGTFDEAVQSRKTVAVVIPDQNAGRFIIMETRFGLDLGSFENLGDLQSKWRQLQGDHGDILSPLKPHSKWAADKATGTESYHLIAGSIRNMAMATRLCARLEIRDQACAISFIEYHISQTASH